MPLNRRLYTVILNVSETNSVIALYIDRQIDRQMTDFQIDR